jgi:threonine dehydratase
MQDNIRRILLARVYDVAIETPLQPANKLSSELHNHIFIKREDLQPVHSFKIRGAYNKIRQLPQEDKQKGIIAASAGNHAQGVAMSAQKLGISATIVMPKTTPGIKIEAVKSYGAEIVLAGDNYSEAYETCVELVAQTGKTLIHPFDDYDVIAGQGTIGREILEQLPEVDCVFIPVGGGGLIAGVAEYLKGLKPDIKIIGVEPDDSNAMQQSLNAGKRVVLPHVGVFADGVAVKQVGKLTFDLCRKYVDEVITVNNDQICAGIKNVFEETRSIVEPAGALSIAGARTYIESHQIKDAHIVTIASGANMTFEKLQFVAERTLLGSGKEALFAVTLPEKAGALDRFCNLVVRGHNITEFSYRLHERSAAHVLVGISIVSQIDKDDFKDKLSQHGFAYLDMSDDDLAKEHVRHMIGGPSPNARQELIYEINFPERPRALSDFLNKVGKAYNISLFHYRGQGGDIGTVMIGFEAPSRSHLEKSLKNAGYEFRHANSQAVQIFLNSVDPADN